MKMEMKDFRQRKERGSSGTRVVQHRVNVSRQREGWRGECGEAERETNKGEREGETGGKRQCGKDGQSLSF